MVIVELQIYEIPFQIPVGMDFHNDEARFFNESVRRLKLQRDYLLPVSMQQPDY